MANVLSNSLISTLIPLSGLFFTEKKRQIIFLKISRRREKGSPSLLPRNIEEAANEGREDTIEDTTEEKSFLWRFDLFFIPTFFLRTGFLGAPAFGDFQGHNRPVTLRTRFG